MPGNTTHRTSSEPEKKHQRLRSQPVYWGRKGVLVAETTVLLVFITNAVSDVFTFTSQAGVAEGQGGPGISLELYLKANPISTKGLSKITQ